MRLPGTSSDLSSFSSKLNHHAVRLRQPLGIFARACGAQEPLQITEQEALATSGADSVYYATRLRGASNLKARNELNFRPRPLEWLEKGQ
jgi:hypothetical protein